ncbi:hypothetical protein B296_00054087 [Ensete ventricosum]|uniref:Uncharacterized protein n=1 Tax=Ensete ventricosum TaxID=4639 RepID=A0A426Y564_ENSVE|nr:hypothetical protein B296_00054087 [Ensete ventricosum]
MAPMAVSSPTISTSQLHSSLRGFHPRPQPLWLRARPSLPGPRSSRGLRVSATAALSVEQFTCWHIIVFFMLYAILCLFVKCWILSEGIALQETRVQHNDSLDLQLLACPICYEPLIRRGPAGLNM